MPYTPLPPIRPQFFNNGAPLAGGYVAFFYPGTSEYKNVYGSRDAIVPLANPVHLDSAGRASIWLNGFYDVKVYDGVNADPDHGDYGTLLFSESNISSADASVSATTVSILDKSTASKVTSDTDETDLHSTTIQANSLGISSVYQGGGLRITAFGGKTGDNGTKAIKLYFGSTSFDVFPAANNTNDWKLEAIIINNNSESSQVVHWMFTDCSTITSNYELSSEDTTVPIELKMTGQCSSSSDSVTARVWMVEKI